MIQFGKNIPSRVWIVVCLCVVLTGLWVGAVYITYQEYKRAMEVTIHPGVVHYGTSSSVSVPPLSMPGRRTVTPMISGAAIREYAYSGHSAPSVSPSPIYRHSVSSVHAIGGGVSGGGASMAQSHSSAARGIRYSGVSAAMPSLALATAVRPAYQAEGASSANSASSVRAGIQPRRAKPDDPGEDGDWRHGGSGDWWYYDEDHWRNPYDGETRFDPLSGYTVVWNGTAWVKVTEYDPGVPVGDMPWGVLFLMIGAYVLAKQCRKKSFLCGLMLLCTIAVSAQQNEVIARNATQGFNDTIDRLAPDFVTVSLVVCDPDEVLYSTLGHAALHLQCPAFDLDYIFSYESESVRDKIWTFLKGDLKMGMYAMTPEVFLETYATRGRGVREYTLNLTPGQKQKLWQVMDAHVAQGADIPYDYFHRGCAKAVVQVVHEAIGRNAIHYAPWTDKYTKQTQREIVRNFVEDAPWEEFFMYFLIGSEGDKSYPCEQKLIVPTDLVEVWQTATLTGEEPLLDGTPRVLLETVRHNEGTWCTPLLVSVLLLLLSLIGGKKIDYILLAIYGVIGFVMTYLIGFSGLPCTSWNWLIIPFNILPVLAWPWRRYWAIPYAALLVLWCVVMTGELLFGHILVDWAHILLALSFAIVWFKQASFANYKKQK